MLVGGFKWIAVAMAWGLLAPAGFGEVGPPSELLKRLGAESYPQRVAAENDLAGWADRTGEEALVWLLDASVIHPDPEVRSRIFAVLRRQVMGVLEEERPGFIGITMAPASLELGQEAVPAVQITSVQDDSPAAKAGLRPGDAILSVDGDGWEAGDTPEQLARKVGAMKPGREIELEVVRGGETKEFCLKLASRPWAAGEWGDFRQMRINPFNNRLSTEPSEESARETAFRRWLEERAPKRDRR